MTTLHDACDEFLTFNRRIRSPRTIEHYHRSVRQYCIAISKPRAKISDLSDDGLIRLEKHLLRIGQAATTVNERVGRVKTLWKWLSQRGRLRRWPTISQIPEPEPYRRAWTVDQVRQLLSACQRMEYSYEGIPASKWWRVWHILQWETGERTGALLTLRWSWLTQEGIDIPPAFRKGRKSAYYRLSAKAMAELETIRQPLREHVFPWEMHESSFYAHYERLLRFAGLPFDRKSKPQRMRRTHLTWWYIGGGDPTARAQHVDPETTRRHYLDETLFAQPDPSTILPPIE